MLRPEGCATAQSDSTSTATAFTMRGAAAVLALDEPTVLTGRLPPGDEVPIGDLLHRVDRVD